MTKSSLSINKDPKFLINQAIKDINSALNNAKEQILALELDDFGNGMYNNFSNTGNLNSNTIIDITIADKFISKFEEPDSGSERKLRQSAIRGWVDYEQSHVRKYRGYPGTDISTIQWATLARQNIHSILSNFWYYYNNAPLDFGPGESYISNQGLTATYDKLNVELWSCTYDALDDFVGLILNSNCLISSFRSYVKTNKIQASRTAIQEAKNRQLTIWHTFIPEVLANLGLLVYGGRGTSVYKNNKSRRFINIEPFGNMLLQKKVGYAIRECLKEHDINLDNGQELHRRLISELCSTIDFSKASDCIHMDVAKYHIPVPIFKLMERYRSFLLELKLDNGGGPIIESHLVEKISSMGNGFTFELLTLILTGFANIVDPGAKVYGDDVIIHQHPKLFLEGVSTCGFQVNDKKTFVNLPFRESCGAFYEQSAGYITCYDIKWVKDPIDLIITMNKIRRIHKDHSTSIVAKILYGVYTEVYSSIPEEFKGPIIDGQDIPSWLECSNRALKRKWQNPNLQNYWQKGFLIIGDTLPVSKKKYPLPQLSSRRYSVSKRYEQFRKKFGLTQIETNSVDVASVLRRYQYSNADVHVVLIPKVNKSVSKRPVSLVKETRLFYHYLHDSWGPVVSRTKKRNLSYDYWLVTAGGIMLGVIKL